MVLFKLNENILIQSFKGEYYIIDLTSQKTYAINEEGYKILNEIRETPKDCETIYRNLGGSNMESEEIKIIERYLTQLKKEFNFME